MRWFTLLVAVAVWAVGLWQFVDGRYVLGGAIIFAAGVAVVVAFSTGWSELVQGMANWLYFWR